MSQTPRDLHALPLGFNVGRAANDYAEPRGRYIADILRRFVQFIERGDWRDERAKVFDALITLSFGAGRAVAWVPEQARLQRMTTLGETVISRAVRDLGTLGMLTHARCKKDARVHRDRRTGGMTYRIDPDPAHWRVTWRLDAAERKLAIDEWAWVYSVNLHPEAPGLPLPSDVPGLADALHELAREAALAHPLTSVYPPQSKDTGRVPGDAPAPDNQTRLCQQPHLGNQPAGVVREADAAPAESHTSVTSVETPADSARAAFASQVADLRRRMGKPPRPVPEAGQVSPPANSELAETGGEQLAGQLTPLAPAPVTRASDVPEHLIQEHPENIVARLSSSKHPDVPDECSLHWTDPDVETPIGVYTGDIRADLVRVMGEGDWAQYRGAWESYIACDEENVILTLGEYRMASLDPRRARKIGNPGAWMGRTFRATSRKWRDRQR